MSEDQMSGVSIGEEDEFHGLGDDLFVRPKKSTAEILDGVVPVKKGPRVKKTRRQKALRVMLKRAGVVQLPAIEELLYYKTGSRIRISKIGFLSQDSPSDPLMKELAKECPIRNRLNRDDVLRSRVLAVGSQILRDGRMLTPIHIHKDMEDGRYECISGRHRLAFLALAYGSQSEVPVYMESLPLKVAREAVAVANDSRPVKALERASSAILRVVGGNPEVDQDKIYAKMSNLKPNIGKYCVFSVIERGYPVRLTFKLSERSSRPDGGVTTVSNVENFWKEAIQWKKGMERKVFDAELAGTVEFLNAFVDALQKTDGFDAGRHMTAHMMTAVGRYYQTYRNITQNNAILVCRDVAASVVSIDLDQKRSDEIYSEIAGAMAKI